MLGLLLFVAAFWVYLQLIHPAYANLNRLKGELKSRADLAQAEQKIVGQVKDLVATYDSSAAAQEALAAAFPLQPDIAKAVGQLNGLLLTSALAPQSFVIDLVDDNPVTSVTRAASRRGATSTLSVASIGTVTFKVRTAGTYEDVKRFLHDLETNMRIMDVSSVSLRPAQQVVQNLYVLEFTVTAYYQKD